MVGKTRRRTVQKDFGCASARQAGRRGLSRPGLYRLFSWLFSFDGSQLPPNLLEIVETFFAGEPFGGEHGPFGEAAAVLGIVAKVNAVRVRLEDNFVHSDYFAFPERRDLQIFGAAAGFAHQSLDCDGGARRRVFFVGVMALKNLPRVIVAEGGSGAAGGVKKKIHPNGKVRGIDESRSMLFDELSNAVEFVVPPGRADDHVLAGTHAGF